MTDYPVSIGDVVALGLRFETHGSPECPVGIVRATTTHGVTVDLYSFMSGDFGYARRFDFGYARRFIAWDRIAEMLWASEDFQRESAVPPSDYGCERHFDMRPIARFQVVWTSRLPLCPTVSHCVPDTVQ